ncbi:MAG: hypothetical protein V3S46_06450 [Nitrospinota bacterium]
MKGYPKNIKTVQDFINLLSTPVYKEKALLELQAIFDLQDDTAERATTLIDPNDESKGWNTEIIDNPMPLYKQKGFTSRQAVIALITEYERKAVKTKYPKR